MRILKFDDVLTASQALLEDLILHQKNKTHFNVMLPTGESPKIFYQLFVQACVSGRLELEKFRFFHLDDFVKPSDYSFADFMKEHLYKKIGLNYQKIFFPSDSAESYELQIKEAGGIDWTLLGLGLNGHVAFNEPGSIKNSLTRVVDLKDESRQSWVSVFGALERVPKKAVTVGIQTILQAKRLRLMAWGEKKLKLVERLLIEEPGSGFPVSWLKEHVDFDVYIDQPSFL